MRENLWRPQEKTSLRVWKEFEQEVVIIKMFPGITKLTLEGILSLPSLKGVILETYGSGNAPTYPWLVDVLQKAIQRGIHIVNVTQCTGGSVIMGKYEASEALRKMGIIDGKDLTTESAVVKLMILLKKRIPHNLFKIKFEENISGEI